MSGDEIREALAEVLDDSATGLWMGQSGPGWGDVLAGALLPVVRRIAAEELRAAADEAHDEYSGWEAAEVVRRRADALDPMGPVA